MADDTDQYRKRAEEIAAQWKHRWGHDWEHVPEEVTFLATHFREADTGNPTRLLELHGHVDSLEEQLQAALDARNRADAALVKMRREFSAMEKERDAERMQKERYRERRLEDEARSDRACKAQMLAERERDEALQRAERAEAAFATMRATPPPPSNESGDALKEARRHLSELEKLAESMRRISTQLTGCTRVLGETEIDGAEHDAIKQAYSVERTLKLMTTVQIPQLAMTLAHIAGDDLGKIQ